MQWNLKPYIHRIFVLSDQNFPPAVPCSTGECMKIIRIENGKLAELVNVLLDVTGRGSILPAGSVVLIFSASHLLMTGLAGYVTDMACEIEKIERIFRGGVVAVPGVPVFIGGNSDSSLTRSLLEFESWLKATSQQFPMKTWGVFVSGVTEETAGGEFRVEKFRHRLPESLRRTNFCKTWISADWTSPREVPPVTKEIESVILAMLVREMNEFFSTNLGGALIHDRLCPDSQENPQRFLVIGGSHARKEGEGLTDRGHSVITCSQSGFRPNVTACKQMAVKVAEALANCGPEVTVVVHCLDNVAFMSRTEEGGDLPIRQYPNGERHVDGDLVLASKERMFMYFRNCLHFLRLLENRRVILLSPLPRYLYVGCCSQEDHCTNRSEPEYEASQRASLMEVRDYLKDFLFTYGLRGFSVLNPGREVPMEDEDGESLWTRDPVHPAYEGYNRIVDLLEEEAAKLASGGKRKATSRRGRDKRMRLEERRPDWVDGGWPRGRARGAERGPRRGGGRGGGRGRGYGRGPPVHYNPF